MTDEADPGWRYIGNGEKDLYECVDCGAHRLPGVIDPQHEHGCSVVAEDARARLEAALEDWRSAVAALDPGDSSSMSRVQDQFLELGDAAADFLARGSASYENLMDGARRLYEQRVADILEEAAQPSPRCVALSPSGLLCQLPEGHDGQHCAEALSGETGDRIAEAW